MKNNSNVDANKIVESLYKRAVGFYYSEEQLEYGEKDKIKNNKESDENCVSKTLTSDSLGVNSNREKKSSLENDDNVDENQQTLVLLKKKVTTHYIPPDMLAIKMLVENFGEEIKNNKKSESIDKLSDEELIELKNKLEKEIINFETN